MTHWVSGPWVAMQPAIAQNARTTLPLWNPRWEKSRWKPTVMPSPHQTYMTANSTTSSHERATPQRLPAADSTPKKGTTTAMRG